MIPPLIVRPGLPPDVRTNAVADWLHAIYRRDLFSGAVLLVKDGNICFERQFGHADLAESAPLTNRSSFSIASLSKQFTGMAMMMLAHGGRLSLDDTLASHLPELETYENITIGQMLHHISGLPDYMTLANKRPDQTTIITARDVVAML